VPAAADIKVLDGWDGEEPRFRAPKRPITLTDLLTHSSGFVYNLWDAELDRFMKAKNFPALNTGKEEAFYPPLMFDPGERWEYGIGIDWAGKLVGAVTGKSLGTYLRENIFAPLDMTSTGYKLTPDMEERLVRVHQRGEDGKLTVVEWKGQPEPLLEFGGGGLHSTAGDYLKFVRMILNDGSAGSAQVLKPETVQLMAKNAMGDIRVTMLKTTNPARSVDAEFFPGLPKSWGLTFMINEETAPTGRPAGSLAWAGIYNTFFWIDRTNGIGGVYMVQTLPFVEEKSLQPFYDYETEVYRSVT
jgi:CubicO group peptidase (beta-lactamase class C family)